MACHGIGGGGAKSPQNPQGHRSPYWKQRGILRSLPEEEARRVNCVYTLQGVSPGACTQHLRTHQRAAPGEPRGHTKSTRHETPTP